MSVRWSLPCGACTNPVEAIVYCDSCKLSLCHVCDLQLHTSGESMVVNYNHIRQVDPPKNTRLLDMAIRSRIGAIPRTQSRLSLQHLEDRI